MIIWNRRIWAWHRRGEGWRAYKGNPHTDHLHVEMSWEGAKNPSQLFNGQPGLGVLTPLVQKAKSLLGLEADEDESPGLDLSRLDEGPSWLEADYEVENEFLASQGWYEASNEPAARAVDGGEAKSGRSSWASRRLSKRRQSSKRESADGGRTRMRSSPPCAGCGLHRSPRSPPTGRSSTSCATSCPDPTSRVRGPSWPGAG